MRVYNLFVRLYGLAIFLASFRKIKAKQWVQGRKQWRKHLSQQLGGHTATKRIWVHCASYGEFEQGRPLIEAIKQKYPGYCIVLTFFSPSGYEAFKNWPGADVISYLPLDTKTNAVDFIALVKPDAVIFIKYEFWLNFLFQLKQQHIPAFLVSAVFKSHHPFFKWYGGIFRQSLQTFIRLFIQDEGSAGLLDRIAVKNYEVCGDTRFDRVMQVKENFTPVDFFETYCRGKQVIVAGSTWPKDEELLLDVFRQLNKPDLVLIIVPHHVDHKSISQLENLIQKHKLDYTLYSRKEEGGVKNILLLDAMGLLSTLYYYAQVAYVGGGFNSGVHNCIEPAVYFKPVVFYGGADYQKFNEVLDLLSMKAARSVLNQRETMDALAYFLENTEAVGEIKEKLIGYFEKQSGTTKKVLDAIHWD